MSAVQWVKHFMMVFLIPNLTNELILSIQIASTEA